MIVDTVRGDIFRTSLKHIAFAVNAEGFNDAGFAGAVSSRFWPELANTGGKALGEVLSHQAGGKTFHAMVCHELQGKGWSRTPTLVEECLNSLGVSEEEPIAVVLMGSGMIGQMGGADVLSILGGLARSRKRVAVYTLS
jgi:hypothetical protein